MFEASLTYFRKDTFVAWDKAWNRSRGYGCVVFNDMESAQRAVKAMDGADVAGRTISVNMDFKQLPSGTVYLLPVLFAHCVPVAHTSLSHAYAATASGV